MRVANEHDPNALADIYDAQAKLKLEEKNYTAAEALYVSAKKPESAVKMYQDLQRWDDALRVAKVHNPRLVNQINNDRLNAATFEGLELRSIGPSLVTGRVADLETHYAHAHSSITHLPVRTVMRRLFDHRHTRCR